VTLCRFGSYCLPWIAFLLTVVPLACAATYTNLIATDDGSSLYFTAPGGTFVARIAGSSVTVTPLLQTIPLQDLDGSARVLAFGDVRYPVCAQSGSSCWLLPCGGRISVEGPSVNFPPQPVATSQGELGGYSLRLDSTGRYIWADTVWCGSGGGRAPNGLFDVVTGQSIYNPSGSIGLASGRPGRRAITSTARALVRAESHLAWADAFGSHPITTTAPVFEAVTDSAGNNVVYVDAAVGNLHWISSASGFAIDSDLGLGGSLPALSNDGSFLAYLGTDGALYVHRRSARGVQPLTQLTGGPYEDFTLGGTYVFALAADGSVVRLDSGGGKPIAVLPPFPEITAVNASSVAANCGYGCVDHPGPAYLVTAGTLFTLDGSGFSKTGWLALVDGKPALSGALSDTAGYVLIPSGPLTNLAIVSPDLPFRSTLLLNPTTGVTACFGTLHQAMDRAVTAHDPAIPGETVHVFLTGLQGQEAVPYGQLNPTSHLVPVANPPALYDLGSATVEFFGLAPGLLGVQQADLQVLRPSNSSFCLFKPCTCTPIPVANR